LNQQGLNPIKPVYDPDQPDGRLNLTASAFNQLDHFTTILVTGDRPTAMQNSLFSSPAVAVTIASTPCAYARRDNQAELAVGLGGWLCSETVYLPKAVIQY